MNRMQIHCLKFRDLRVTVREACSGKLLAYIFCLTLKRRWKVNLTGFYQCDWRIGMCIK